MSAGVGGEVTVGATINPGGLVTTYEIEVECCDKHQTGQLPAVEEGREVSMNVTGLQPGTYWFSVRAVNSAGEAYRRSDILEIPPIPPGACPTGCSTTEPYKPEVPQWVIEANNAMAAQAVKEYEAKQQQIAKEREEQQARERARIAADEAEQKALERQGEEEAAGTARAQACIVPSLKNKTLSAARGALKRAHCRLGEINGQHRHPGLLRVIRQGTKPGETLAAGAAVTVTLAPVKPRHR